MSSNGNITIAKNTAFLTIRMMFVLFVSLYTSRVFLKTLGIEDYGISNVVCGFVAMFNFFNASLSNAIQRYYNAEKSINGSSGVTKVFNSALVIQSVIAVVVYLSLQTIGVWYINNKMVIPFDRIQVANSIFQFSALSTVFVIMQTPFSAAIMAYEKMNFYACVGIIDTLLKLVIAITIPYASIDKLYFYGMLLFVVSIFDFSLYFFYSKIKFKPLTLTLCLDRNLLKKMVSFSGWNFLGTFACMIREQGLNVILNLFFGPIVNAARGVAYQVSSAIQNFVVNIGVASRPQMISSYVSGNPQRTMQLLHTMSKVNTITLLLLALPVCLEIDYVLNIWLGNNVPQHANNFVVLILIAAVFNNLNSPVSTVMYATGRMKMYEIVFSSLSILVIPVSYFAMRLGCSSEFVFLLYCLTTFITQVGCVMVLRFQTIFSLKNYLKDVCIPLMLLLLLSPVIPVLVKNLFLNSSFLRLLCVILSSSLSVLVMSYFVVFNKSEKLFFTTAVAKMKSRFLCR